MLLNLLRQRVMNSFSVGSRVRLTPPATGPYLPSPGVIYDAGALLKRGFSLPKFLLNVLHEKTFKVLLIR